MSEDNNYISYRWWMLICVSLSICASATQMVGVAPILGDIAHDLTIPMGQATNLMMGFVLANAFFLTWGGAVCDRYGITTALVLGLLCASVPAVLLPFAGHDFKTVFVFRLIQGASMGFIFATMGPVLALWFPLREQGLAGGLMIGSLSVGSAVGVLAAPFLLTLTGHWQTTMALLSILGWGGMVLSLFITRRPPSPEIVEAVMASLQPGQKDMSFLTALTRPQTWLGVSIVFCNAWGLYCLYNLVPSYLAAEAPVGVGLGSVMAGQLSLALTLTGIFAMIAGGLFLDKVAQGNYRLAMIIGFLLTAIATYFILTPGVQNNIYLLVCCLLIAGWGVPFMNASISACIVSSYPAPMVGRMVGLWFGLGTFGGAVGIYLGGVSIARTGNFYWAILPISIAAVVGIVFSWFQQSIGDERENK